MRYFCTLFILVSIVAFYSCDYVNNPYPPKVACDNDTIACPVPTFTANPSPVKKVLLEDYTGHHCTNCPKATKEAIKLDTTYGEKLVVMSVHAGGFADPSAFGPLYSYDFRTTAGNTYDDFFAISANQNPNGMINRIGYPTNTHRKNVYTSWGSEIQAIINNTPDADIQIINSYDDATRKLCIHVQSKFLKPMTGTYKLVVLLTEDSIVKPQLNNGVDVTDYMHRHVLRASISCGGEWGDALATGTISNGSIYTKNYVYNMPTDFKGLAPTINHCAVIAYIYDDTPGSATYKQIIQVEESEIE